MSVQEIMAIDAEAKKADDLLLLLQKTITDAYDPKAAKAPSPEVHGALLALMTLCQSQNRRIQALEKKHLLRNGIS